jgi:hypothetical protein
MKGDMIPDPHHISRYCGGSTVQEDGRVGPSAFILRTQDEYLSVNWLENLDPEKRDKQLQELRSIFKNTLNVRATAKIAVLNVGRMRTHVRDLTEDKRDLQVKHEPIINDDDSHCGIYNLRDNNELIAELISQSIIEEYGAIE